MLDRYSVDHLLGVVRQGLLDVDYQDTLIKRDYGFSDFFPNKPQTRKIDLAVFAQEPLSPRSACFGVTVTTSETPDTISKYRALGAPQILSANPDTGQVCFWKVLAQDDPLITTRVSLSEFRETLVKYKDEINPAQVLRAKAIGPRQPWQLELFEYDPELIPVLEHRLGSKLDQLLSRVIAESRELHFARHDREFPFIEVARLVFRLVAAKLLIDREHPIASDWRTFDGPTLIDAVERFYSTDLGSETVAGDEYIQNAAWETIRSAFPFASISVESLAYVYENTLVNEDIRKQGGVHATPTAIAEYLVRQLPFERLDPTDCRVFEPFSGHAPFLVAALGQLKTLLPLDLDSSERHDHFQKSLSGIEADGFAREVGLRSLMLADYPNKDHWDIQRGDVFKTPIFNDYLKRADVVLSNPPFERFDSDSGPSGPQDRFRKGAEALRRVLEIPPKMLGFVLPRSFLSAKDYDETRKKVESTYTEVEILSLPDNTFAHSNVEPILLIANHVRPERVVRRSALVEKADFKEFLKTYEPTWKTENPRGVLWSTPLQRVWDALSHLPLFKTIADPHRGIGYIQQKGNEDRLFSPTPKAGFEKGLRNVPTSGLEPYLIKNHLYLNMDRSLIRRAFGLPWDKPKVIANAARIKGDRWVMAAAVDTEYLRCSQRFHCIWPKGGMPLEVIAAILNGPIANAYLSTRRKWGDLEVWAVEEIPIPRFTTEQINTIVNLVQSYAAQRMAWLELQNGLFYAGSPAENPTISAEAICWKLVWQIDAEVLAAYCLPRTLETELLDYFKGYERKGPFGFVLPSLLNTLSPWLLDNNPQARSYLLLEEHQKNAAAKNLYQSLLYGEAGEGNEPWEELGIAIDEDRLSDRKFYS